MGKKINLPVLPSMFDKSSANASDTPAPGKKPTLESARARLGGSAEEEASPPGLLPGRLVTFGEGRRGIVLYAGTREVHVMLDPMRVKRLAPSQLNVHEGPMPEELRALATDARVFGLLTPGQPVRYATTHGGPLTTGKLVEKCRYGGLVARTDGTVLAVGFRKLWPPPIASEA